jgi:DinB superfamily
VTGQVEMPGLVSRQAVHGELEAARAAFHRLVEDASAADLRRPSDGTRWTNEQLLFHMLFGYLITRALLVLARAFSRLPTGASRSFARLLNSATRPFDLVNFYGSCAGARFVGRRRLTAAFDRVIASLHRRLAAETDTGLRRGMHYPVRWDPFFKDFMTLADIYHYPAQHFGFHRDQLTLTVVS